MDKLFHVFVRKLAAGAAVAPVTLPHLTAFGPDVDGARRDLAHVLRKLLRRGELLSDATAFTEARLRRVSMVLRCLQGRRLLAVPMRFSVLTFRGAIADQGGDGDGAGQPAPARGRALRVLVPRLELDGTLEDAADLDAYVEEIIRHALHLAPLARLAEVAYAGEESLDTLIVTRPAAAARPAPRPRERPRPHALPPALGEACRRLDLPGGADALDRAYGREPELALLEAQLAARVRASVLLVGPRGVGKTCLVHELAARSLARRKQDQPRRPAGRGPGAGDAAEALEVYSTSASRIVAGMRYLGEWQDRLSRMVAELRERRAVLCFDNLAELVGYHFAGDGLDLARFLLPAVEAGEITLVVEATAEDAARAERLHGAFLRALRPLVLAPLGAAAARRALAQVALGLGRGHGVRFADAALDRALDLAERFEDGALPGAAVGLLRAAANELRAARGPGARGGAHGAAKVVDTGGVTAAFCARTGYPPALVDPGVALDPEAVRRHFAGRVLGQDHATLQLARLVFTLKTNLADPRKPLGSFLLLGPTGVGKTESALALAAYLFGDEKRLFRLDMAEHAAPGSAARLLRDDPAGLVRRVREQPFGVLLLDEIEKADGSVHDLLLQLLGEGRLTDEAGRTVSFRNTIVMLTSNLGADAAGRAPGFGGDDGSAAAAHEVHYRSAAAAFFRPELLNRFDQIIPYHPLGRDVVARIARMALEAALGREGLARRGVRVDFDPDVVAVLADLGFDPLLGARPLKRAIERHVVAPLADLLARTAAPPRRFRLRPAPDGRTILVEPAAS